EVDVREVIENLIDILGVTILGCEDRKRQTLVNRNVLHTELATFLPERVANLFIIGVPTVMRVVSRVEFNAGNLEIPDLAFEIIESGFAIGRVHAAEHDHPIGHYRSDFGGFFRREHMFSAIEAFESETV